MTQSMVLLTAHGTLLCGDGAGGLYHQKLDVLGADDTPVLVDLAHLVRSGRHERMLTKSLSPLTLANVLVLPQGCEIVLDGTRDAAHGNAAPGRLLFMCRADQCQIGPRPHHRRAWENFLFLTEADFATLRHISGNTWIIATTKQIVQPREIHFGEAFRFIIGGLALDLRYNLPFLPHSLGLGQTRRKPCLSTSWWKAGELQCCICIAQ